MEPDLVKIDVGGTMRRLAYKIKTFLSMASNRRPTALEHVAQKCERFCGNNMLKNKKF
jgi:hypothetical protein